MSRSRTVDNSERPAQPEPGEDEAVNQPAVREQARYIGAKKEQERSEKEERERQTGE